MKKICLSLLAVIMLITLSIGLTGCITSVQDPMSNNSNSNVTSSNCQTNNSSSKPTWHVHKEVEVPEKPATCMEEGLTAGKICVLCKTVTEGLEVIPMTGHALEVIPEKPATCTETGLTAGIKCSVCGEIFLSQEETEIIDHNYVDGVCDMCGYAEIFDALELEENETGYTIVGFKSDYDTALVTNLKIPSMYNGKPITVIGERAFRECPSLESVTIPESVISIESQAFYYCELLKNVIISEGLMSIGNSAFGLCSELTEITLPDSVTFIDAGAFYYCSALTDINIPYGVTSIEWYTFGGCSSLKHIIIPDSVTFIDSGAFRDCTSLTSITIPDSVTCIGDLAFYNCRSMTSLRIGSGITAIGESTFGYCDLLTSVIIPNTVTSIGYAAFTNCYSLTSVTIGSKVTSIDDDAFANCDKLVEIYNLSALNITKDSYSYGSVGLHALDIYTDKTAVSKLITDSNGFVIYFGGEDIELITYVGKEAEIVIPDIVTSIGKNAFDVREDITSIIIPGSVTFIDYLAFASCNSLETVYYKGTAEEWADITIGRANENLTLADIYYYSKTEPTDTTYNYWHYGDDGITPTVWTKEN